MALGMCWVRGLVIAGLILGGGVIGPLALAIGTADAVYAQQSSIGVQGNRRVEAETVRSYFRVGPGESLDAAKIDAALKALYQTGLFQDVRINQSGGRIVVTVVENPVINRIAFEGNSKLKDEQLQGEIQSKPRGTLSRATVQADVSRIVEVYQRNGRYDVRVEPKIVDLPNSRVDLIFEINEGVKTGVKKLIFVGNKNYSDYRLKDQIKTGETNFLSFMKSNDTYDPDRIEADRDLLRRFYLKHGFADVRIISAVGEYDPARQGFIVTFTIDEGEIYRFGTVDIQSHIPVIDGASLRSKMRSIPGETYNAEAIEKTVEEMTIEIARRGYPFATARPRGDRSPETKVINVVYSIDDGPRVYIERINIRGNTRTRDYVIRREFDFSEGDAYNRALVQRAERRIKNLQYFKVIKITNEPGSAPDRIVLNVDVEEQSTGQFSVAGGYSTMDGIIGEVSVGERNLLGHGHAVRAAVQYGSRARGAQLSFTEPYLFGNRLAFGVDLSHRETIATVFQSYASKTSSGSIRFGVPLTDNLNTQFRYTASRSEISLPLYLQNCDNSAPTSLNGTYPTSTTFNGGIDPGTGLAWTQNCYGDGEASLAIKKELAQGPVITSSVGYSLFFNTLDQNRNPTKGIFAELRQDIAGVGGDVNYIKSIVDTKFYHEIMPDIVGFMRLQGGHLMGWGGKDLRMLDHFQGGPNFVRGFMPMGFGPRDLTDLSRLDALGGTMYWGATVELQSPLSFLPKDIGIRGALFADAGQVLDYKGPTSWTEKLINICTSDPSTTYGITLAAGCNNSSIRASAGVSIIWDSPFGPLRFDIGYPILKEKYDRTQLFRFGGGTAF